MNYLYWMALICGAMGAGMSLAPGAGIAAAGLIVGGGLFAIAYAILQLSVNKHNLQDRSKKTEQPDAPR